MADPPSKLMHVAKWDVYSRNRSVRLRALAGVGSSELCQLFVLTVLFLVGCAPLVERAQLPEDPAAAQGRECRQFLAGLDERVKAAGVNDAEAARIKGFPYLRVDRFLSSYREHALSEVEFDAWVDRLEALDRGARQKELANLPPATYKESTPLATGEGWVNEKVARCAALLRDAELADDKSQLRLRKAAVVPPGYQSFKRVIGLYPISSQFVLAGVRRLHNEVSETFATPQTQLPVKGRLTMYTPPPNPIPLTAREVAEVLKRSADNPLGIPEPIDLDERARLFATFAPLWQIDVVNEEDRIGRLEWGASRFPKANTKHPVVYQRISHTRFQGDVLLQLNYQIWFPARPHTGRFDILAGNLDGITWRVTLDMDGEPIMYDAIHNCGCYHMFFPARRLRYKTESSEFEEPLLIPTTAPSRIDGRRVLLRIAHTSHYIEHVTTALEGNEDAAVYTFVEYDQLRSLPLHNGAHRSVFGPNGIVPGTKRGERWVLWPMGIPEPGAMRQWGHHATAFVGRRYFDEPYLVERYFELDKQSASVTRPYR